MSKPIVTIDCWGTLLKSSPAFKTMKNNLIRDIFSGGFGDNWIDRAFINTKEKLNYIVEATGAQPSKHTIFNLLFKELGLKYDYTRVSKGFVDDYQALALEYAPEIYSTETLLYLQKLSSIAELHLSSNTMFIQGLTLFQIFQKIGLNRYITSYNFSDKVGKSKPHPSMYNVNHEFSKYHIGDNPLTDGSAPSLLGINSIIINSNNQSIKDAYSFIEKREVPF